MLRKNEIYLSFYMVVYLILASCCCVVFKRAANNRIVLDVLKQEATNFIYESFVNTCNGVGYKDLFEWQSECKRIWNLDYIAWSESSDFLPEEKCESLLLYGVWEGTYSSNEIFYRLK